MSSGPPLPSYHDVPEGTPHIPVPALPSPIEHAKYRFGSVGPPSEDLTAGTKVRFGAVNQHGEERRASLPSQPHSTVSPTVVPHPGPLPAPPQSILKTGAVMSPVDYNALTDFSDSGSEGMSDYDDEDEEDEEDNSAEGSVSEDDSSGSSQSGTESESGVEDIDPRYRKKQFLYGLTTEEEDEAMQSQFELLNGLADPATLGAPAPSHFGAGAASMHDSEGSARLESATLADYEDMDGLLVTLDKYIKKNRNSRSLAPGPEDPLAVLKSIRTRDAPSWAQEAEALSMQKASSSSAPQPATSTTLLGSMIHKIKAIADSRDGSIPEFIEADLVEKAPASKADMIMAKLTEANVKKVTTRIYIEDAKSFKTLLLTSLMSADQIISDVITKFHQEESPNWTLFELCNDIGVERPLRDWEIVTDIISAWDTGASVNAIVMKKYGYRETVSARSIAGKYPRVQGWMHMETKPGKWQRRFFVLRESNLYYYKDAKQNGTESVFCGLSNFDVYTLSLPRRKTPTKFAFALRSTDSMAMFENKQDHVRFLCVEKEDRLFDWVLAIRLAKSEKMFADFPEVFDDYDEISDKVRRRRHGDDYVKGRNHSVSGTLIDQADLTKPESLPTMAVEPRSVAKHQDGPLVSLQTQPASLQRAPTRKNTTRRPARPVLPRRITESPSGSDDEPLLVRQMRQSSGVLPDDDENMPLSVREDVLLRRTSRREVDREEGTSQSERERDDASVPSRRKTRTSRTRGEELPERTSDPLSRRTHSTGTTQPSRSRTAEDIASDRPRRSQTHHSSSQVSGSSRRATTSGETRKNLASHGTSEIFGSNKSGRHEVRLELQMKTNIVSTASEILIEIRTLRVDDAPLSTAGMNTESEIRIDTGTPRLLADIEHARASLPGLRSLLQERFSIE
ncbi:hypothetical protein HKX48_002154 [Thoreauomyces humboldtii]|nr:hypothetical protein HKX48_002154 [Thoreauomyces humboldtii]